VMGNNPSYFQSGDDYPVENVSWNGVQEFIKKLNEKEGAAYRLPTEAEWEYAARAGTDTAYYFGNDSGQLGEYSENSDNKTHPVAQKKPNAWGLYDMHGNVLECCQDMYASYPSAAVTDPVNEKASYLVYRGGFWGSDAEGCRSACRYGSSPDDSGSHLGFRLSRGLHL
ncbi:MAG: formylglycine-generating enzyme family protein, partial [Desulfobacteraceae bacterium]|nr:formylglycine-generating enzyme family protein [Desulfobacteraceae bacterium]